MNAAPKKWDEAQQAALYAEFAEEDRALAEVGMADYAAGLAREDTAFTVEEPPANAHL